MQAMEEADVIILLLDGRQGVMPGDHELVKLLRRTDKEVFFAVNKIDAPNLETELLTPFWELGEMCEAKFNASVVERRISKPYKTSNIGSGKYQDFKK